MKKLLTIIILGILIVSLVACSDDESTSQKPHDTKVSQSILQSAPLSSSVESKSSVSNNQQETATSISNSTLKTTSSSKQVSSSKVEKSSQISQSSASLSASKSASASQTSSTSITIPQNFDVKVAVDLSLTSSDGTKIGDIATYKTINAAVNALKKMNLAQSKTKGLIIAAGTYNEKVAIPSTLANLKMIGSTNGVTKISYGDYAGRIEGGKEIGTDASATIDIQAEGFEASNIFFENSFDYFNPPTSTSAKQALAALVKADKVVFYKCSFTGHQDTLEAVSGRQYYKECFIYGSTDFIFGNNSAALFDSCEIKSRDRKNDNGGYIAVTKGNNGTNGQQVPTYGFVFKNCKLTADSGVKGSSVALGRPWRADATVAYINCEMGAHISKTAYSGGSAKQRYVYMNGGTDSNNKKIKNEPQNAHFYEYGNTGSGALSSAVKGMAMLTKAQADLYTLKNIFATKNGAATYSGEFAPNI